MGKVEEGGGWKPVSPVEDSGAPREMEYANEEEWPPNSRQVLYYFFASSSSAFKKKEAFQSRIDSGRISSVCPPVCQSASLKSREIFSKSVNHRDIALSMQSSKNTVSVSSLFRLVIPFNLSICVASTNAISFRSYRRKNWIKMENFLSRYASKYKFTKVEKRIIIIFLFVFMFVWFLCKRIRVKLIAYLFILDIVCYFYFQSILISK